MLISTMESELPSEMPKLAWAARVQEDAKATLVGTAMRHLPNEKQEPTRAHTSPTNTPLVVPYLLKGDAQNIFPSENPARCSHERTLKCANNQIPSRLRELA